jgi:23S rRNA (cytidine1920-2'-O)/16S rRNA (cytidine1409-2'-O)-methyltransferase
MSEFVSRAGQKLEHALVTFGIDVTGFVCADLGSNVGGFVDCLLQRGAKKVYAIDTGYGVLEWKLRKDPRVVVMERTNAMHVKLPEKVKLITIDVAWTKQKNILPAARKMLDEDGIAISLIKPQYEGGVERLREGVLPSEHLEAVLQAVKSDIAACGFELVQLIESPIRGGAGNVEILAHLRPA